MGNFGRFLLLFFFPVFILKITLSFIGSSTNIVQVIFIDDNLDNESSDNEEDLKLLDFEFDYVTTKLNSSEIVSSDIEALTKTEFAERNWLNSYIPSHFSPPEFYFHSI
jgi:hypothetical protein